MSSIFDGFDRLSPIIHLHKPSTQSNDLIIICTWLGAAAKHASKYIALYREVAPEANILIIESTLVGLISTYSSQRRALASALPVVQAAAEADNAKTMLHVFSNGGSSNAVQLAEALGQPLHLTQGMLLDSCPSNGAYWRTYNAFMHSMPRSWLGQLLGALATHCLLAVMFTASWLGGTSPIAVLRQGLLDGSIFSGSRRRCYLYSKQDQMVLWTEAASHAAEAKRRGALVDEVVFEESGHCAHLTRYKESYKTAVQAMWEHGGEAPETPAVRTAL